MALSALVFPLLQMTRMVIDFLHHKLKYCGIVNCQKVKYGCCEGLFRFSKKNLNVFNKNAQIMQAIHGKSLCKSAKYYFQLILRNSLRYPVYDKTVEFILVIMKIEVSLIMWYLSYYVFTDRIGDWVGTKRFTLSFFPGPCFVVGIVTYHIASGFFGILTTTTDTQYLSFLEDMERNNGTRKRPYMMTEDHMKLYRVEHEHSKHKRSSTCRNCILGCCDCSLLRWERNWCAWIFCCCCCCYSTDVSNKDLHDEDSDGGK